MEPKPHTIEKSPPRPELVEGLGLAALGQNEHEIKPTSIEVGSLVTLRLIEADKTIQVYISEHEKNVGDLLPEIQLRLPDGVRPYPLTPQETSSQPQQRRTESLAERLRGKASGETIELLNHKKATIVEVEQLS